MSICDRKCFKWSDEKTVLFLQLWPEKSVQDKLDGTSQK